MPWVSVREPFAAEPRRRAAPRTRPATDPVDDVEVLHGVAYVTGLALEGDAAHLDAHADVELDSCTLSDLALGGLDGQEVKASRCSFTSCDLTRARFRELRTCHVADSKLTGADLSDARLVDVVFERCVLHLTDLRMARLQRVRFVECTLREVDATSVTAEDVSFDGSTLDRINLDRLRGTRVDLRGARSLSFEGIGRLDGCLIGEDQLHALAYELAFAAGLGIERREERGEDREDAGRPG